VSNKSLIKSLKDIADSIDASMTDDVLLAVNCIQVLEAKLAAHDVLLEKADGECCKLRLANHELEAKLNEVLK
jgi:hypothetical protein